MGQVRAGAVVVAFLEAGGRQAQLVRREVRVGGDPSFIAVTGGSAGGHLVAVLALTQNDAEYQPGFEAVDTSVDAAVPYYGVYDLTNELGSRYGRQRLRFLERTVKRVHMNADTDKLILPIDAHRSCAYPVPLKAIYSLAAPRDACRRLRVSIEPLSPREAFVELVKSTFNRRLVNPQRLERQFGVMASLADVVSVKKLAYPRAIDRLQEVRRMVLADLD